MTFILKATVRQRRCCVSVFPESVARCFSFVLRRVSEVFLSLKDRFESSNSN